MSQLNNSHCQRIFGLDTLRAMAICMVLMDNYRQVSGENIFGFMSQEGWVGVNLFFVLSGYLIGNQVLSDFAMNQKFSLRLFYIRRFLRTLPNYYVVLALYFIFPYALDNKNTASIWEFLTFTQNLAMDPNTTFTHSWSLCVEEQFYLIFPLCVFMVFHIKKPVKIGWTVVVGAMLLAISIRTYEWYVHGQANISGISFMKHIYYSSFARFDGLLPGIAIAALKNFHPGTFSRVQKSGNYLLVTGLISVGIMLYFFHNYMYVKGYGFSLLLTSFGYTFLAISFSILVLAAFSANSWFGRIRFPGAASLALWSYAIYLIHPITFHLMKKLLIHYGVDTNTFFAAMLTIITSILTGWILYQAVETPFMKLRARYYPANHRNSLLRDNSAL